MRKDSRILNPLGIPSIQIRREMLLVPRTRSSHNFSAGTIANFGFKKRH